MKRRLLHDLPLLKCRPFLRIIFRRVTLHGFEGQGAVMLNLQKGRHPLGGRCIAMGDGVKDCCTDDHEPAMRMDLTRAE